MKAIIKFDLNDPDDIMHHYRTIKATDMALVLWKFAHNIKTQIEGEIEQKNLSSDELLDRIYELFWDEMADKDINLDKIII
jgi:hypothetical protein